MSLANQSGRMDAIEYTQTRRKTASASTRKPASTLNGC